MFDLIKNQIPDEVLVLGLQLLPVRDILNVSTCTLSEIPTSDFLVNRRMNNIITESQILWRYLCERDGFALEASPLPQKYNNWREMYNLQFVERYSCCARCGQRHTEGAANEYHPGRWHDLSYPEILESQNRTLTQQLPFDIPVAKPDTDAPPLSNGALFVTQLHENIDQPIAEMVNGAKLGSIGAAYIAVLAGGATRSLTIGGVAGRMTNLSLLTLEGLTLALPVIFVSAVGGLVYGVSQMIAGPFKSLNTSQEGSRGSIGLESWTCCGSEGSFAFPCSKCTQFAPR